VNEQNLRNGEDVTKDTLGISRTCIKEEECACICKKLIKEFHEFTIKNLLCIGPFLEEEYL